MWTRECGILIAKKPNPGKLFVQYHFLSKLFSERSQQTKMQRFKIVFISNLARKKIENLWRIFLFERKFIIIRIEFNKKQR
jgi:hypothetical protein